jgi:hypothetical protein
MRMRLHISSGMDLCQSHRVAHLLYRPVTLGMWLGPGRSRKCNQSVHFRCEYARRIRSLSRSELHVLCLLEFQQGFSTCWVA